jgi:hypothetical protein
VQASAVELSTQTTAPLVFSTNGGERMRLDSSGRLGLGTSTVSSILHINAGAATDTNVRLQAGVAGNHAKHTYSDSTNTVQWTSGYRSSTNTFGINVGDSFNSTGLTIDSSGRLGLGTISPGNRIQINDSIATTYSASATFNGGVIGYFKNTSTTNSTDATIRLEATGSAQVAPVSISAVHTGDGVSALTLGTRNTGDVAERLRITGSGNVGIGTTSPEYTLDSRGSINVSGSIFRRSADNTTFSITNRAAQPLTFGTDDTERARIDSSGRLLVGTSTAPSSGDPSFAKLTVAGPGTADSYFNITRSLAAGSIANNSPIGSIFFTESSGGIYGMVQAFCDGTGGTNDYPGRLVFSTTADGASSPTERMRIANDGSISSVIPGGSTLYPRFGCRAWVNFNGTGTVAIRASGNVSSITDNGAGDYTVNFTTAMADANYSPVVSYRYPFSGDQNSTLSCPANGTAPTTSAIRMRHANAYGGGSAFDTDYISIAIFR